jgi:hypothetical protein
MDARDHHDDACIVPPPSAFPRQRNMIIKVSITQKENHLVSILPLLAVSRTETTRTRRRSNTLMTV